jgi:hypothetical protein
LLEDEKERKKRRRRRKGKRRYEGSSLFHNPYLYMAHRFYVTSGENENNIKMKYPTFGRRTYNVFYGISKVIQGEIKRRLNSGNVCYHSVRNILLSRLLSKIVKIRIYKTIILRMVPYGCETWSLILREEHRLRAFENWLLRRIFGPKRNEVTGDWRKLHNVELKKSSQGG